MLPYAVMIRRELHEYPEIGFELPRTLALVRRELQGMGVEYTEAYGKSSIVATVNPEKRGYTVGIRADMDALPIREETDLPFKSKIDGQMHACGHDAHTAILLDTVRKINEIRDKVGCRVKFLFQSAEEYPPSGAMLMAEDGVMDDIDCILALHVDTTFPSGTIGIAPGAQNATSDGFYLEFLGKSAHVANQQDGVDAITMAVKAYTEIEFMIAKEVKAIEPVIFNVGSIHGGATNNVICDRCEMYCTLRTHRDATAERLLSKIERISHAIADTSGGEARFKLSKHYPIVYNDPALTERVRAAAAAVIGEENVIPKRIQSMGGEDFSYFTRLKPGCMFRLGIGSEEKGTTVGVHNGGFMLDEDALSIGSDIFTSFVIDNSTAHLT